MKLFVVAMIALIGCLSAASTKREEELEGKLQNIFEIIGLLVKLGKDFACSAECDELLAILNLPAEMAGIIQMAKGIICGGF